MSNAEMSRADDNIDRKTVEGFGEEWAAYDQVSLSSGEHASLFSDYFSIFPFDALPAGAEGFDLGCGSGRWAEPMADRAGMLHCIDPSEKALAVAKRRLLGRVNVRFHLAASHEIPLPDSSQDFGYSLGVLHHIPDTEQAMRDCVAKLKLGAPFLTYIYYDFENKPLWFRGVWKVSDGVRRVVSRLPFGARKAVTSMIAAGLYWPMTRIALAVEWAGGDVDTIPLAPYRRYSFYTMRTDALDRFGTRLEQRFSRAEVKAMMERCGLRDVRFREEVPYWVACGFRRV